MTARLALLCPGQGGQHAAMFDLAGSDPAAAALLQQWLPETQLGQPLQQILADDALLFSNRLAQPLIVAATAAVWSALQPLLPGPALVAGYSVGEIAAYHVAGAVSAPQAIRLAASRAELMDACLQAESPQVLFAVNGVAVRSLAALLAQHSLYVAIETDADSCIAGGLARDMHLAAKEIAHLGGRIRLLPVTVASHTPLMDGAVLPFAQQLRQEFSADPQLPVLSGLSGQALIKKEQAITVLSQQMAQTIHWSACMDACAEQGVTAALELGPGAALARMLHARHPQIACRSVSEFRSLQGVRSWLQRL
ncbi:ACP S-malonyltransferase [Collimonas sp.]|jgi:[acyl-carrier-protein] S-malonyltransferase|uniref:ACP S-malonyltransferase n=1 Tax=Collimonas sp. TaxID=1963772 RepID=UPI002BB891F7|nr:acyltransferase domain-containing protein [Collimonas sp.]HWW05283.1 acyltransferase domain-containing protein [Collimonas sp.]